MKFDPTYETGRVQHAPDTKLGYAPARGFADVQQARLIESLHQQAMLRHQPTLCAKRNLLVGCACGWRNSAERSTFVVTATKYNGQCQCGGKRRDGQKRSHHDRKWIEIRIESIFVVFSYCRAPKFSVAAQVSKFPVMPEVSKFPVYA